MVTLKTPVTPRAFHSAAVFRNQLYIFGGVTGPDGSTPIEHSELFLAIDISTHRFATRHFWPPLQ
jgi:hypothetical protein